MKHLSVRDNLRLAQYLAHVPQDDARIADALSALGVGEKAERRPSELSQGEQQRVAIARALIHAPSLLLADEPPGNLDSGQAGRILQVLRDLVRSTGLAVLVATHDHDLAGRGDLVWRLHDGRMAPEPAAAH
jgi:ABC-type lipoprotein export system ATPase subunit